MTTLVRWNPFAELSGLHRGMGILEDFAPIRIWRNAEPANLSFPADLFETDDHVVLTIKGEAKDWEKTERENYYCQEIHYGSFSRSIPLPTRVNHEEAEADFEHGVLTVRLPKAEEVRPKTIKVNARE